MHRASAPAQACAAAGRAQRAVYRRRALPPRQDADRRHRIGPRQTPCDLLGCADSRWPQRSSSTRARDLFVVRTAGHVIDPGCRLARFRRRRARHPLVVVLGHDSRGAVAARGAVAPAWCRAAPCATSSNGATPSVLPAHRGAHPHRGIERDHVERTSDFPDGAVDPLADRIAARRRGWSAPRTTSPRARAVVGRIGDVGEQVEQASRRRDGTTKASGAAGEPSRRTSDAPAGPIVRPAASASRRPAPRPVH